MKREKRGRRKREAGGEWARVESKIRGDGDCEREDAAERWVYMALDGRWDGYKDLNGHEETERKVYQNDTPR